MGTNYYWRDKPCGSCGRFDELHVCKSKRTWRAYQHRPMDEARPEWGYLEESPTGFAILSLADWRKVFAERTGELRDEYGEVIADPIAWLDAVEPWKPGADGWHDLDEDIQRGVGWRDAAGFRFYAGEFS